MKTVLVAGGVCNDAFVQSYLENGNFDFTVAVDAGLDFFFRRRLIPDMMIGDFDSVSEQTKQYVRSGFCTELEENNPQPVIAEVVTDAGKKRAVEICRYGTHKDFTDLELALQAVLEKGSDEIHILAATGSRLDHMLGSIRVMGLALQKKVPCFLVDEYNRLQLIDGEVHIKKSAQYGQYVSLLPLGDRVTGITLTGFEYPLSNYTMEGFQGIGISNEIKDREAVIQLKSGVLILVESRDSKTDYGAEENRRVAAIYQADQYDGS